MALTLDDIQNLSTEVRSLVNARLPLERHLAAAGHGYGARFRQLTEQISAQLEAGRTPEDVVQECEVGAPRILTAAIAAGIRTGRLNDTIEMAGDLAHDLMELRRSIFQALAYPLMVATVALLLFVLCIRTFLDRLRLVVEDMGAVTSPTFRTLLTADAEYPWWPAVFPALAGLWLILRIATRRSGAVAFSGPDRLLYLIPGVYLMIRELRSYSLARIISLMVHRSVPLTDALKLAGACCGSRRLERACRQVSEQIEKGTSLSQQQNIRELPAMLMACLRRTEFREGELKTVLEGIAGYYRRRLQLTLGWLQTIVPTAMFVVVGGGAVLLYAATVFWPVTQIYQIFSQ